MQNGCEVEWSYKMCVFRRGTHIRQVVQLRLLSKTKPDSKLQPLCLNFPMEKHCSRFPPTCPWSNKRKECWWELTEMIVVPFGVDALPAESSDS